jgi:hypothetical protein
MRNGELSRQEFSPESRLNPAIKGRMETLFGAKAVLNSLVMGLETPKIVPIRASADIFQPTSFAGPLQNTSPQERATIADTPKPTLTLIQGGRQDVDQYASPASEIQARFDIGIVA